MYCALKKITGIFVLVGAISACGQDDKKKKISASAQLALANQTSTTLTSAGVTNETQTPGVLTTFGVKIVAVYVSEDVDSSTGSNIGLTSLIYYNPECGEKMEQNSNCDISGGNHTVTNYFDLARPSDQVNADLNGQKRPIELEVASDSKETAIGTFRYARIEFSSRNPERGNTVKWATTTSTAHEFIGVQGSSANKIVEPIAVSVGDTIVFTLSYNYSNVIQISGSDQSSEDQHKNCSKITNSTSYNCFVMPEFKTSAAKAQ